MIAFRISKRAALWDLVWIGATGVVVYGMSWPLTKELALFPTIFLSYAYFLARGRMLLSLTIRESDVVSRLPFRRMVIPFHDIVLAHSNEFEAKSVASACGGICRMLAGEVWRGGRGAHSSPGRYIV